MPNTDVWGQQGANPGQIQNQNLVSLGNEIIDVVNIDDANRTALHVANTNADVVR